MLNSYTLKSEAYVLTVFHIRNIFINLNIVSICLRCSKNVLFKTMCPSSIISVMVIHKVNNKVLLLY